MKQIDLENGCWICLGAVGAPLSPDDLFPIVLDEITPELTRKELEFFGRKIMMPRMTAWYGETDYNYSGAVNKAMLMTPTLQTIARWVEAHFSHLPGLKTGVLNSVLCNLYPDGNDSVDWHSDNETGLGPSADNILIASVTFGGARKFVLKNKHTKQKLSIDLGHGDVLIMGGQTQKHWQHKVPKTSKKVDPRLNLTYRVNQ